ncbi:MAG: hypothetical protein EOO77_30020 [Oxalobacteraceae bacterium]|nr:MAG: hypothetical protein EOO77_30020 [Oxalobacteraceae bacterium]
MENHFRRSAPTSASLLTRFAKAALRFTAVASSDGALTAMFGDAGAAAAEIIWSEEAGIAQALA